MSPGAAQIWGRFHMDVSSHILSTHIPTPEQRCRKRLGVAALCSDSSANLGGFFSNPRHFPHDVPSAVRLHWSGRLLSLRLAFSLLPNSAVSSPSPAGLILCSLCRDGTCGLGALGRLLEIQGSVLLGSWRKPPHAMLGLAGSSEA